MIRQDGRQFFIQTRGAGLVEITSEIVPWVAASEITTGLVTLHVRHTSASLIVQENADPEVRRDLERFFRRLVPEGDPLFEHVVEGPDDMPAHVRAALTATTLSIPVVGRELALGTWQGIFLWEHRRAPRRRIVVAHLIGE